MKRVHTAAVRAVLLAALGLCLLFGGLLLRPSARAEAASDPTLEEFLATFTVSRRAEKIMDGGELTVKLNGKATATLDLSRYASGSRWYVGYMHVRNTMFLHLKNETDASEMQISFLRHIDNSYDEACSVLLPLETDGEYHLYPVDFSAHPLIKDVSLKELRFQAVGAESGSFSIDYLTFEREETTFPSAGEILSCTADGNEVTVTGVLTEEYAGSEVTLYRTGIENMNESLSLADPICSVRASGTQFSFSFPYYDGEVSMLSSKFLAAVGETKVGAMFDIENWRELTENPYAFGLPARTVSVLDYGAKGDMIADDTEAIQSAIDDVSAQGGGTVVLKGDESRYGRRYIATTVRLKDNVELRIEEGAVLWQSQWEKDYRYEYAKGHDYQGVLWGHPALSANYPLIYANGAKNIKVTGGGTVRLCDPGVVSATENYGSYSPYCKSLIHVVPIGLYDCKNVELSDLAILRTSCYHVVVYACENVYLGSLTLTECNCLSGDGISVGAGSKNVVIDRCFLYTNDDAIVLVSHSIAEPRGLKWWFAKPDGGDNRLRNITVRHSAVTPGNLITFVAWGTDASDLTWQAMTGIYVYDNILGERYPAKRSSVGSHCMNVWAGQGGVYGAPGSTVPISRVVSLGNSYRGKISNLANLTKGNWVTDCGDVDVITDFYDSSFLANLAYWEYGGEYGQNVRAENGVCTLDLSPALRDIYGMPSVFQGLYLESGEYTFSAAVETSGGAQADLFVRHALTEEPVAAETVSSDGSLTFTVPYASVYLLGVEGNGGGGEARVSALALDGGGTRQPFFAQDFSSEREYFASYGWIRTVGALTLAEGANGSLFLGDGFSAFDLKLEYRALAKSPNGTDGGMFVRFGGNIAHWRVEYSASEGKVALVSYEDRTAVQLAEAELSVRDGAWVQFGISVGDAGKVSVYADGELLFEADVPSPETFRKGGLRIGFVSLVPELDNLVVAEAGTLSYGKSEHWTAPLPDTPDNPDNPDKPDTPDVPDKPDTPDNPDTPDMPSDPEVPSDPKQGCGGAIGVSSAAVCFWTAAATVCCMKKKKEKDDD